MKTSPLSWQNQFSKYLGTALFGLCLSLSSFSQSTPIPTPPSVDYPGIMEGLEKLIQISDTKFNKKMDLLTKNGKSIQNLNGISSLELDPDYLNSLILHSDPSYIKLASTSKCRFYDVIINDLLKSTEGKLKNIFVTFINQKQERDYAIISKKDFINNIVPVECPESSKLIAQFQIKNIESTINSVDFENPTNKNECHNSFMEWLNNSKTPYFCKLHEFIKEANGQIGDPKDLEQRQAIAKILEKKLSSPQRDYLENLCEHFDEEKIFCDDFLNVSFWSKISKGTESPIYAEDICKKVMNFGSLSANLIKQCLSKLRKENDLCLYPEGKTQGLVPRPQCDNLATALNASNFRSDYRDCPAASDQHAVTNMGRLLLNISKDKIASFEGPCSVISSGVTYEFNKKFNNDENWKLEACYDDKLNEKEVCYKSFFGNYADSENSYTTIVSRILQYTRGADKSLKCEMIDSENYNPLLLKYRSGCYIIFEKNKCFISHCKHKILYNDRSIDFIKLKNEVSLEYFPSSIVNERYSQQYLLTKDYRQNGRSVNSLNAALSFLKKGKNAVIHGVGCAEDLLPSFFKSQAFNQCSPLPFIIDGHVKENDKIAFVTRTSIDSLQAPRLISWGLIFSSVKSYQRTHPLRLWTLYGLD